MVTENSSTTALELDMCDENGGMWNKAAGTVMEGR
jgi:hypothetical protein